MMKVSALSLAQLRLPLRRPFASGMGTVAEREAVLVGLEREGEVGWGEAAPYPGVSREDVGQVWNALLHRSPAILAGSPNGLPPTAAAAVEQAAWDLRARLEGVPLWEMLGGTAREVTSCAAIGLEDSPGETCARVREAVRAGAGSVKVKIAPGADMAHLREIRDRFPDLEAAADGNGAYREDDPLWSMADEAGLAYVEQPLPAADLEGCARLRARLDTPVCLDESAHTLPGAMRAAQGGYADLISLKPGLLGVGGTLRAAEAATEAGIGVKIGGLLETSVGRAHALALAMLPSVAAVDLIPARWFLREDAVSEGLRQTGGKMTAPAAPGIGLEINPGRLPRLVRTARLP